MLAAIRSQVTALSLRSATNARFVAVGNGAAMQMQFSTATTDSEAASSDDTTAAFLSATTPTEFRTVKTMKKDIRGSPRKMTYLAQQIRGLPANEAILQMTFSPKRTAKIVKKTVQNAINLADIKYQIEPENLKVAECFVNKGHYLKRLRIMGRGRSGIMHHPHTHLTVVLREFDPSKKPLNRFLTKKLARENAAKAKETQE